MALNIEEKKQVVERVSEVAGCSHPRHWPLVSAEYRGLTGEPRCRELRARGA